MGKSVTITLCFSAFAHTGRFLRGHITPRALPWAKCFWAFGPALSAIARTYGTPSFLCNILNTLLSTNLDNKTIAAKKAVVEYLIAMAVRHFLGSTLKSQRTHLMD